MTAKLYVILGSHACRAGILMCDHKGIDYRTVNLATGFHPMLLRLRGFPGRSVRRSAGERRPLMLRMADQLGTVPALRHGDDRVQTNHAIARYLERLHPEPALFPTDPERRAAVEEAEAWGSEVFQMTARRLGMAAVLHGRDAMVDRGNTGRLGPILWQSERVRFAGVRGFARTLFDATRSTEPAMLEALPGQLDRIDSWVEAGVLNGPELNVADFMIAPSMALIAYRRDLKAELEARPSWALVDRLLPAPA